MSVFDFLTDACRVWLAEAGGPAVALSGVEVAGADAAELEHLAFVHGLEPLLHDLIESGGLDAVWLPASALERWEGAFFQNLVFNGEAVEVAARLTSKLDEAGIEHAFFKGPVTLARAYRQTALRPMVDLDLLCREASLAELVVVAGKQGFEGAEATTAHHLTLTCPDPPLALEPHFDLYDFLPRRRELLDELLRTAEPVELDGRSFRAVAPEAGFVLDVAHLVHQDFRIGLKNLLDLAALARFARPALDPQRVRETAGRFDLAPELELASAVVDRLFSVRLPGVVRVDPGFAVAEAERLVAELGAPEPVWPAMTGIALHPGWRAKLTYAWERLFPPSERLAALAGASGARRGARLRHLLALTRWLTRQSRRYGLAAADAGAFSVKRRVYERRRREPSAEPR